MPTKTCTAASKLFDRLICYMMLYVVPYLKMIGGLEMRSILNITLFHSTVEKYAKEMKKQGLNILSTLKLKYESE